MSSESFCLEKNLFIREVSTDVFTSLRNKVIKEYDAASTIVGSIHRDVLTLSMYLYDFVPEKTIHEYKAYLSCKKIYNCNLSVITKDDEEPEKIKVFFEYAPVLKSEKNVENKFHFQIFAKDEKGNRIPRDPSKGRNKRIAEKIISEVITNAIVDDLSGFDKWNLDDTDSLEQFKETSVQV